MVNRPPGAHLISYRRQKRDVTNRVSEQVLAKVDGHSSASCAGSCEFIYSRLFVWFG